MEIMAFQTLNEVIASGEFKFKTYGETSGAYLHNMAFTGLTETEKELVLEWFGDRCIGSESPEKFQKYFNRLWDLYAWQYRNQAAAWFGTNASDFKNRIIGEFSDSGFNWNSNFLITVDTAINGVTANNQTTNGNTSGTTTNGGTIGNVSNNITNSQKGGTDTTTTTGTNDTNSTTTNSGSDITTNSGTVKASNTNEDLTIGSHNTQHSNTTEGETTETKLAGSTTKNRSINKANPMSIANASASGGDIPTLDWTYASGQDASESITTPDGKSDKTANNSLEKYSESGDTSSNVHSEGSSNTTTENTNTVKHGAIVEGETSNSSKSTTATDYGATDRIESNGTNTQTINTNSNTTGTSSGTVSGNGSSDTTSKGRASHLAELYGEFISLMNVSPAWAWMMEKIEPAFLAIYDI